VPIAFSHYNLRAPRALLDTLRDFYMDVVGLTSGERPPFESFGYWLYADGHPVLHLTEAHRDEQRSADARSTFDHAAFNCAGRRDFERKLAGLGIQYVVARVPETEQIQLFFRDPAGNGIELNFSGAEG
jgi:catechol-2,3-dioxygenase